MERYGWVSIPFMVTRNKKIVPVTKKKNPLSGCGDAWVHEERGPDWLNYVQWWEKNVSRDGKGNECGPFLCHHPVCEQVRYQWWFSRNWRGWHLKPSLELHASILSLTPKVTKLPSWKWLKSLLPDQKTIYLFPISAPFLLPLHKKINK